jgi:formylglycine-generating enzyme required for sulfatase activity
MGPEAGSDRVFRGGSWYDDAQYCRSAYRNGSNPDVAHNLIGFRSVRSAY